MKIVKYGRKKRESKGAKFLIVSSIIIMFVIFIIGLQIGRVVEKSSNEKKRVQVISKPIPEEDVAAQIKGDIEKMQQRERIITEEIISDESKDKPAPEKEKKEKIDKPEVVKNSPPATEKRGTIFLQVGVFSVHSNANRISRHLKKMGIESKIETEVRKGKSLERVLAGPFVTRSEAGTVSSRIRKRTGIKPIIVNRSR